jgi:hypothetical protein
MRVVSASSLPRVLAHVLAEAPPAWRRTRNTICTEGVGVGALM